MPNFKVKCYRTLHVLLKKEQTNTQVYKLCVCIVNQYLHVKIHTCHAEVTPIYEIFIITCWHTHHLNAVCKQAAVGLHKNSFHLKPSSQLQKISPQQFSDISGYRRRKTVSSKPQDWVSESSCKSDQSKRKTFFIISEASQ